ncbi:MAG: VOC family protein [Pseudomonadales bacterium]
MNQQSERFFSQIRIYSSQSETLCEEMAVLFGTSPGVFQLGNTTIDVVSADADSLGERAAVVGGLIVHGKSPDLPTDCRGLDIQLAEQAPINVVRTDSSLPGIQTVDHVVLRTANANDCIRLFRDDLGARLALDQTVEEWGGRMLFFREGGMTLEVIEESSKRPKQDFFWGICYRCGDIETTHENLVSRGVSMTEIREGRKPGTRVATIKSHVGGIPSLLLE